MNARRRRQAGQTLILLALLAGILLVAMALVIDNGSQKRVRAETSAVCDAAALAGMAELAATTNAEHARQKALEFCRLNGYELNVGGVTQIEAYGYNSTTMAVDSPTSDRYHVKITRELPQHFMAMFGIGRTGTTTTSVAALISAAPVDVNLDLDIRTNWGAQLGFPDKATLAQIGPAGNYELGDPYDTPYTRGTRPNPTYQPNGMRFDLQVPTDLVEGTGSSRIRVEIFDADCINDPAKSTLNNPQHPVLHPEPPADTDGDPTEPETGALDEIYGPPPGTGGNTTPLTFPARSTQTEYTLLDRDLNVIAQATYGPSANTPFFYHTEAPRTATPHLATDVDPAQAQKAVDLKWITPEGFEFDTLLHPAPYRLMVRTTAGSSENGYSLRVSSERQDGDAYDQDVHGVTPTSTLGIYAHGKAVISFLNIANAKFTVAAVPSRTQYIRISNFDTEVGAASMVFSMVGFDSQTGQGVYPILFEAPPNANGPEVVQDLDGNKYYTELTGTRSPNASWRTDQIDLLEPQPIPRTDGSGHLVFDMNGLIEIVDRRIFEGGDIQIEYRAGGEGQIDTSGWQFSYYRPSLITGEQDIILIR